MQWKESGNVVALVVDMQVGVFATPRLDEAGTVARINAQTAAVRAHGGRVVFIRHTDAADGLAEGSDAWQVLPSMVREAGDETRMRALIEPPALRPRSAYPRSTRSGGGSCTP